jgi:hypothetical protein
MDFGLWDRLTNGEEKTEDTEEDSQTVTVEAELDDGTPAMVEVEARGDVDTAELEDADARITEVTAGSVEEVSRGTVQARTDSGADGVIPVASEHEHDLTDRYFNRREFRYSLIDDERVQSVRDRQVDYSTMVADWVLSKDDLVPSIKERVKSLIMGEEGVAVEPADADSEADQRLAEHLRKVYDGRADGESHVKPADVVDQILLQNIMTARCVLRASDLKHLDPDTLERVRDGETGEEMYIQRPTDYVSFDIDEQREEVEVNEHTSDLQVLEIGADVFEVQLFDRPPLEAVVDDVVGKLELKQLKARKAQITSFGGLYVKINPPDYLQEQEYHDKVADPNNDGEQIKKLELELQRGLDEAFNTLEKYKSGTIMSVPSHWEVNQIELPDQSESMNEQIREYNKAISRRLLFPLDLVELQEGAELSRDTIFKTLLNTVQGWRQEILAAFDGFAETQAKIHGMENAEVNHKFPPIEPHDAAQLIKLLKHAPLAGLSQKEIRQIMNKVEGVDVEVDTDTDMGEPMDEEDQDMVPDSPKPEDAEEQAEAFLDDLGELDTQTEEAAGTGADWLEQPVQATHGLEGYETAREAAQRVRQVIEPQLPARHTVDMNSVNKERFRLYVRDENADFVSSVTVSRSEVDGYDWLVTGSDDFFNEYELRDFQRVEAMAASAADRLADAMEGHVRVSAQDLEREEIERRHSRFSDTVNMTVSDMEDWAEHACSDLASLNPREVRQRVVRLLETDVDDWGASEYEAAGRVISFVSRMTGVEAGEPVGSDGCDLSKRTISLMNWGYQPDGVEVV